jgi:hypothetical protein
MVPIIFSVLGVSVCTFLIYVFVQFRRELLHAKKGFAWEPRLTEVDVRRIEADLMLERMSAHVRVGQQAMNEAVRRKEMLPSAVLGLVVFLTPFVLVMLLNSLWPH